MDDPEGNLVIVERVVHENQRHFPYWEHGWIGTAHILNSTQYGTLTSPRPPGIFRRLASTQD
ncbi:MAG: hypothetical protein J6R18_01655, partial [Kiritimatiellae bacterium]|nr:hypothetical protein [Kiritimatiellia bacterium]